MGTYFKTQPESLYELLELAALDHETNRLAFISPGDVHKTPKYITYSDLFKLARTNAALLPSISGIRNHSIILLHFDNHQCNIEWLWATIAGGYLPTISTPFTNNLDLRKKHLEDLKILLNDPIILTSEHLLPQFEGVDGLNIQTIEKLDALKCGRSEPMKGRKCGHWVYGGARKTRDDIAILMLTSGSTGNAKAVSLRHGQILTSVEGKSIHHSTTRADVFLNWIGLDHVANLTETHIHAMYLAAEQIHVQATDLLIDPVHFLTLVSKFRITHSFAPNFFLASLRSALEKPDLIMPEQSQHVSYHLQILNLLSRLIRSLAPNFFLPRLQTTLKRPDLSCLKVLISGGEANVVETCDTLTRLLKKYRLLGEVIRPGFGMTETCAGSIYSRVCPSYDVLNGHEFASLGDCIPGLEMRVSSDHGELAAPNEIGNLELKGPILFREYYNNPTATAESFTSDGWFITGDRGLIDSTGFLSLTGRSKESIIINGVKYFPHELETGIESANIKGLTPSYTAVFPHRPKGSQTEALCVVYLPTYEPDDVRARVAATDSIAKMSIMQCGVRPYQIIPLTQALLPKSALGKLSRAKIRTAFEAGDYATLETTNDEKIKAYRIEQRQSPTNDTEAQLLKTFARQFDLDELDIGVDTSLFEMGVSSIEIMQLKTLIQKDFALEVEIPIITMMTNPSIRGLAAALLKLQAPHTYAPIITLQPEGHKTPLFLVHPGLGEILVFLNLSKYIVDRPVYAFRARGFDGEELFHDLPEVISTYYEAIKKLQPTGPYAIAGYSYGSMIAFELAKVLESKGDTVGFLGSFNLPPHIKFRMEQLNSTEVMLNLAYFLDLITEEYSNEISPQMLKLTQSQVLDFIISKAPPNRMAEMALDKQKMTTWSNVATRMPAIALNYEPSGTVAKLDVFYAIPLKSVAKGKQEWLENHLTKWSDFVDTPVRFHEVEGAHYTMISSLHVFTFQKTLRLALEQRGL